MGWKRLDVAADAVTRGTADALKASFEAAYAAAGAPRNAALFEMADAEGLHLYFSPGAAAIFESDMKILPLKSASAPPAGARLTVGDTAMWTHGA